MQTCENLATKGVINLIVRCRFFMECSTSIQCPFCGEQFELVLDTSFPNQRFTTDCEVCCRPFEVFAECEPGEVLSLTVEGG